MNPEMLKAALAANVAAALVEDIGNGDITAGLIPAERQAKARIITRDDMVMAGKLWVESVFVAVDPSLRLHWLVDCAEIAVRWSVARSIVTAWFITMPAAAAIGAIFYFVGGFFLT